MAKAKKVTKAQLIAVAKELNKEWKMDPKFLVKGTVDELEANQITLLLPEIKWEDGVDKDTKIPYNKDEFSKETKVVIDYLVAKAAPVEKEEKVEETEKEKKAREKAEKKAAKDVPEETAKEKKAREKAEKKAAKDAEEGAGEATLADQVRGEMKKGTLIDFVNDQDEFKKHRKALLGMKNHLAMRKQMSLILAGEKPDFTEVKKEKKEKKVNPLIAEIEAIEKKKALKAFCKDHDELSGIKVKDFEEADELKAVMIAALAPKKKKEKKAKTKSRMTSLCDSIKALPKKGDDIDAFVKVANETFMTKCGGEGNEKQTKHTLNVILPVLLQFNIVSVEGNNIKPA